MLSKANIQFETFILANNEVIFFFQKCETRYETVYEEQCQTVSEQQCTTVNEQQCSTVQVKPKNNIV